MDERRVGGLSSNDCRDVQSKGIKDNCSTVSLEKMYEKA